MKGGVMLYRGSPSDARRYLDGIEGRGEHCALASGASVARFIEVDGAGIVQTSRSLTAGAYEAWVGWIDPISGAQMGVPRLPGETRRGSPLFAELVINNEKYLSIAAVQEPRIAAALRLAQWEALEAIGRWLAQRSVCRIGSRGVQRFAPVERMQFVGIAHDRNRLGEPYWHVHLHISTRVQAAGQWRALDTSALFAQQQELRELGSRSIAAHPLLNAAVEAIRPTQRRQEQSG